MENAKKTGLLERLRRSAGLSQAALGQQTRPKVGTSAVSSFERGLGGISYKRLRGLAKTLGLKPDQAYLLIEHAHDASGIDLDKLRKGE